MDSEEKKGLTETEEEGDTDAFPWFRVLLVSAVVVETALLLYTAIQRNTEGRELSSARQKLASVEEHFKKSVESRDRLKGDLKKVERHLEQARSDKSKLEIEVQEKDLEKLRLQLQQQELVQSKTELEKRMKREKQIAGYLRRKIVDSKKNELVLIKKVEELVESKNGLEEQLKLAEQDKQEPALDIEGVPLKEVVVTDAGRQPPPLTGTILIANHDVDPPFVIINIGVADGVSIGDRLTIMKKKKRVGYIVVSKVYRNMAVADIDRETTKKKVKKNLKVVSE